MNHRIDNANAHRHSRRLARVALAFGLILLWLGAPVLAAPVPAGVVDITLPFVAEDGKLYIRHGRGVLIGPRTVMTAAHVAADFADDNGRVRERVLWDGVQVKHLATGHKAFAAPDQVHLHPSVPVASGDAATRIPDAEIDAYVIGTARFFDIAVIGLRKPLGDEVASMPALAESYPGIFDKLGVVVGSGKRRLVETVVTSVDRYVVHTQAALDGALADTVTSPGDSGGPLFVRNPTTGTLEVYGIASALTTNHHGAWRASMYSRADSVRHWVAEISQCVEHDAGARCAVLASGADDLEPVSMR